MPRPRKWRRICCMPGNQRFGPLDRRQERIESIQMTVDEFETIRLIDREGLNQEECAGQMDVARTTVQAIYSSARSKLARALVDGADLLIRGGEYRLCEEEGPCGQGRGCCHRHGHRKEKSELEHEQEEK